IALLLCVAGCAPPAAPRDMTSQPVSATSPLAKVRAGMTFAEVVEVLGPPSSQSSGLTMHAFNPLAVGNQAQVTAFHYSKLGRVIFAGPDLRGQNAAVIGVEEDSRETGYR